MEESRQLRSRVWLRMGIRLVGAGLLVLFFRILPPVFSTLFPFFAAFCMAAALNPLVRRIQRRLGWNRRLLSFLVVVLLFMLTVALVGLLFYLMGQELSALARHWEELMEQWDQGSGIWFRFRLSLPEKMLELVDMLGKTVKDWLREVLSVFLSAAARQAAAAAAALPGFVLGLVMFLLASYFLTADYPYLRTRAVQSLGEKSCRMLRQLKRVAATAAGGYLKAQLILSGGVFCLLFVGFLLWGQDYAFLLAFGLAVLDFIPLIGAGVVLLPWNVVSILTGQYGNAVWTAALLGITAGFRRLAEPKIVGDQTGLSPVISLLSIYLGMKLAGVPGMILGPVLTLMGLNLSGIGLFHGLRKDIGFLAEDISRLFLED